MTQDLEAIDQPDVHHEETDVNIRAIFGFGVGLFIAAVVIHLAVWGLFAYFERREGQTVREFPLSAGETRLPPEPRLQTAPREDLQLLRTNEDRILNGYTWVDRNAGLARIPIAEAMKMTVERGLPARPNVEQTK